MSAPLAGWPVFPVNPTTKAPLNEHGFKDATVLVSLDVIRSWPGVGVRTGNGLFVLDVDQHGSVDGERALCELVAGQDVLPKTYEVTTPSGGRHLYFTYDQEEFVLRSSAGKLGVGVDVRADGGYVVAPPTPRYVVVNDREPARLPDWLALELLALDVPSQPPKPKPVTTTGGLLPGDDFEARTTWTELLEARGWTYVRTSGDQELWRRPGKTHGVSACANWRGNDLLTVYSSNADVSAGTYGRFNYLVARDYSGDHRAAARDLASEGYGTSGVRLTLNDAPKVSAPERGAIVMTDACSVRDLPLPETCWGHRLVRGAINLLAGTEGLGKSTVRDYLVASFTSGERFPGWSDREPVPRGTVALLSYEENPRFIDSRCRVLGADTTRLKFLDGRQTDGGIVSLQADDLMELEQHLRTNLPDCVALCIDPWKNLAEDINEPRLVNRALTALSGLAVRLDLYVVLVAHFNASGTVAGYRGLQQQARSRVEFRKMESSTNDVTRVAILHEKTNVTAKAQGLTYEWRSPGEGLGWHTGHNPLHWTGTTSVTSEYLLRDKPRSKIQIAEDWLRSLLADGPLPSAEIKDLADEEGITDKTLRRARQNVCDTSHAGPGSTWGLK